MILLIGWQNINPLNHPNTTIMPQARPSGEILNYLLSHYSDILVRSLLQQVRRQGACVSPGSAVIISPHIISPSLRYFHHNSVQHYFSYILTLSYFLDIKQCLVNVTNHREGGFLIIKGSISAVLRLIRSLLRDTLTLAFLKSKLLFSINQFSCINRSIQKIFSLDCYCAAPVKKV